MNDGEELLTKTILLVEDEVIIAMNESMLLEEHGYSVVTEHSGEAAIQRLKKESFDLILMDIDLGSGIDGTSAAKNILTFCEVPIVFLSSHTEPEVVEKTEDITSYGYIVKDSGSTVLLASIKMAFRLYEARKALQSSERNLIWERNRFKKYLNIAEVMLILIGSDGIIKTINPKGCKVLGYNEDELIGLNWFEKFILTDNLDEIETVFNNVIHSKSNLDEYHENWVKCGNGDKKLIAWHNSLLKDENGEVLGVFSSGEDITERERLTSELVKSNNNMKRAEEIAGIGSWSMDPETGLSIWSDNYYKLIGIDKNEEMIVSHNFLDRIHPDDLELVENNMQEAIRLKEGRSLDFRYYDGDSNIRWARSTADIKTRQMNGEISEINGIFQDITVLKKHEDALKTSQHDFYQLFYGLKDGAVIYRSTDDLENFIVEDMNEAGQKISEVQKSDVVGKLILDVFPDCRHMGLFSILQEVARTGDTRILPFRNYKDDRLDEWLENYVFALPSGRIVSVFSDQKTLVELRNNEHRLKIINELSSDYSYCHALRSDGSLEPVWHIGSFDEITGYTPEELYELGGWSSLIHPDDLKGAAEYVEKLFSGEKASFTARIITKSGAFKWIHDRGMPWFDEVTGKVIGTYGFARDITDKKAAEDELEKSELKYRMLYLNAPLPYQSLDNAGDFIDVNPAWLKTLGYERREVVGHNFADFLHPDWKTHFEKNFPAFKARGFVSDVQFMIRHKDGSYREISFEGCIGYNSEGVFSQTYCVFKDITEQKKAERENELLIRELNHRVKNNLLMVSSLVNLKNIELDGIADLSDLVSQINAITLIHKHLEQNKSISKVNIKTYLEQLVTSVFKSSSQFEIKTLLKISSFEMPTKTVATLGIIVNEIATNALKYGFKSREKSEFSIRQTIDDDEKLIVFSVSNSGNDFPEDIEIENSKGLGLKLIKSLVSQLNGKIELKKKPETTFILKIPVVK